MHMTHIHSAKLFTRCLTGFVAAILLLFAPMPYAFAESAGSPTSSAGASCSPVAPAPTGIQRPTGDDADTYTYNACTGLWENKYYTWSPATQIATPKTPNIYTCDATSWKWVTREWMYDPASQTWFQQRDVTGTLPVGAVLAPSSFLVCAPSVAPLSQAGSQAAANTPSGATPAQQNAQATGTTAILANQVSSTSTTGSAAVIGNMVGGDATSGNAAAVANILNSVQSPSSLASSPVMTFVANIDGNVQGDLIVDPSQLQPAAGPQTLNNPSLTVNAQTNGAIDNTIAVGAQSGNADVGTNTSAGNATTGNAEAIANVVNMLDSAISSGQSFIGTVNINGNLNGNILVPQNLVNDLIASNVPSTTVDVPSSVASSLGITNNQAITNNVNTSAQTGTAVVDSNTSAGNASSGNAATKVTIFNLTGNQVVGANCLLVFVNVSGTWVGVIMNAPAGATAAELGGGVTQDTPAATVAVANNEAISNSITAAAQSGNALVSDNTSAGNASSGNADAAVNLLNMEGSQVSVSGWFGILFINVFGNWYGNFGAYVPPAPSSTTPSRTSTPSAAPSAPATLHRVFQFVPTGAAITTVTDQPLATLGVELASSTSHTLGASLRQAGGHLDHSAVAGNRDMEVIGAILVACGLLAISFDYLRSLRTSRTQA